MQAGKRYTLFQTLTWSRQYVVAFFLFDTLVVALYQLLDLEWLKIPWQPLSLIGIAVAFYLGFKNNSSYDRLWEARKIWGGIVNTSRAFTVMVRDFVSSHDSLKLFNESDLQEIRQAIVYRHIAWLYALTFEMRKLKAWEHDDDYSNLSRERFGTAYSEEQFDAIKEYLSKEDFEYIMSKGNRSSHLLSLQSKHLMQLRKEGQLEHFRHLEIQSQITELYTLQGKSERIKNFPFPRQYASVNYFFVVLFITLLPFGMLDVFTESSLSIWVAIPFAVVGSWVFWMMEMIGDYSENPFEGLSNDVPISAMARGIEIDIRQMLDETDLPEKMVPVSSYKILV